MKKNDSSASICSAGKGLLSRSLDKANNPGLAPNARLPAVFVDGEFGFLGMMFSGQIQGETIRKYLPPPPANASP
jgi:hypothetical protein